MLDLMRNWQEGTCLPFVSVIIPCRNEEMYIDRCLNSILSNDYPRDKIKILVADGMSRDGTRSIVAAFAERYPFIKLPENTKGSFTAGVNLGIKHASDEIILIMGSHACYEKRYISKCVKFLMEYGADNVGGVATSTPFKNTLMVKAIDFLCLIRSLWPIPIFESATKGLDRLIRCLAAATREGFSKKSACLMRTFSEVLIWSSTCG